jgi:hypothetical protein
MPKVRLSSGKVKHYPYTKSGYQKASAAKRAKSVKRIKRS